LIAAVDHHKLLEELCTLGLRRGRDGGGHSVSWLGGRRVHQRSCGIGTYLNLGSRALSFAAGFQSDLLMTDAHGCPGLQLLVQGGLAEGRFSAVQNYELVFDLYFAMDVRDVEIAQNQLGVLGIVTDRDNASVDRQAEMPLIVTVYNETLRAHTILQ
jgi:hypothetical protein